MGAILRGGSAQESSNSRRHRQRRYHVPLAARGLGYEACDVPVTAGKNPVSPAAAPQQASPNFDDLPLSEKEVKSLAALNGLQVCAILVLLVVMLVTLVGYRAWIWQVAAWLRHFPMPTR